MESQEKKHPDTTIDRTKKPEPNRTKKEEKEIPSRQKDINDEITRTIKYTEATEPLTYFKKDPFKQEQKSKPNPTYKKTPQKKTNYKKSIIFFRINEPENIISRITVTIIFHIISKRPNFKMGAFGDRKLRTDPLSILIYKNLIAPYADEHDASIYYYK